jgi:hypothetical protein
MSGVKTGFIRVGIEACAGLLGNRLGLQSNIFLIMGRRTVLLTFEM